MKKIWKGGVAADSDEEEEEEEEEEDGSHGWLQEGVKFLYG